MTPLEQVIIERIVKIETENASLKESIKDIKTDFKELEETIKKNHEEIQNSIKELKETLTMGRGIYKFLAIIGAIAGLIIAGWKLKP